MSNNDVYLYRLPVGSVNIENLKRLPLWKRILFWWRTGERSPFIPREKRAVPEEAVGTLADTMRKFEEETKG